MIKTFRLMCTLVLLAALSPLRAQPLPELPPRLVAPTDQAQFRRFVLDNGLRVLLVSDPRFNRSAAALAVGTGAIDDPPQLQGLAHFLEHMLFLGTDRFPDEGEYRRYIQRSGGSQNAFTSSDHTLYHFEVRHDALEGALDRFSRFFIAPRLNPEFVSREVNAVHNEAMRHVQNDFRRVWAVLREHYDPASGESRFSTGNKDTLALVTPQAVRDFYERHYSAHRMALVVAGRAGLDELERLARTRFAEVPRRAVAERPAEASFLPRRDALRLLQVEPAREVRELRLEFVLPSTRELWASRPDQLLATLLDQAGAGGLQARLKAQGLANDVSSWLWERSPQYGSLWLSIDLTAAGQAALPQVMEQVFGWLEFLRRSPYPRAFHDDRARIGALNETFGDRGEGGALVTRLAGRALFHPLDVAERVGLVWGAPDEAAYRRLLDALVPSNMIAALQARGLPTDRRERIYGVPYAYREEAGPAFEALRRPRVDPAFRLPGANPFMPTQAELLPERALALIDEPALALHYAPDTEFLRPQTAIAARLVLPRSLAGPGQAALLSMWTRGLQDAMDADVADARAAGVQVGFDLTLEGLKFSVTGFGDSAARVARHLAARLRDADPGAGRFADLKEQLLRDMGSYAQTEAVMQARDRREALQREFRWLPEPLRPAVLAADADTVRRFGRQLLAQGRLEVLVHGHLAPADAVRTARAMAQAIGQQGLPSAELLRRRQLVLNAGETVTDSAVVEGPNAVWLADLLLGADSPRTRAASLVLGAFVSPPFYTELRTRQQLGYIVGASPGVSLGERWLGFVIQSSTHGAAELRQRAQVVIDGLPPALAALRPAEWQALKAGVRSRLAEKPTGIAARAERLFAEAYDFGGDWGRATAAVDALEALTQADAVALLTEALAPATRRQREVLLDARARAPAQAVPPSFSDRDAWKRTREFR